MTTIRVSAKPTKREKEDLDGSDGTGISGDTNRVFTLTTTDDIDITDVFLNGLLLTETTQYTKSNTNKTVTMVNLPVWDDQPLTVVYNV